MLALIEQCKVISLVVCISYGRALPTPYGRTSRVWDSLLAMKSGCAGSRGFAPRPGQNRKESFSSYQETGKVFTSKFGTT